MLQTRRKGKVTYKVKSPRTHDDYQTVTNKGVLKPVAGFNRTDRRTRQSKVLLLYSLLQIRRVSDNSVQRKPFLAAACFDYNEYEPVTSKVKHATTKRLRRGEHQCLDSNALNKPKVPACARTWSG